MTGPGNYNFYDTYCNQKGKPFFFPEFGAAFHVQFLNGNPISPGPGELAIKRGFYIQVNGDDSF